MLSTQFGYVQKDIGGGECGIICFKGFFIYRWYIDNKAYFILKALLKLFCGYSNGSTQKTDKEIVRIAKEGKFDFVFIDSSLNGHLVKSLNLEATGQVICFFITVKEVWLSVSGKPVIFYLS